LNISDAWWLFWTACFAVAGSSFAVIAAIVLFRGVRDLRAMIHLISLKDRTDKNS
jgi:hypothetical protein